MTPIRFTFQGKDYVIPAMEAFAAGEAVEDIVPLSQIQDCAENARYFKLARAMSVLLGFAGANVPAQLIQADITAELAKAGRAASKGVKVEHSMLRCIAEAIGALTVCLTHGMPVMESDDTGKAESAS